MRVATAAGRGRWRYRIRRCSGGRRRWTHLRRRLPAGSTSPTTGGNSWQPFTAEPAERHQQLRLRARSRRRRLRRRPTPGYSRSSRSIVPRRLQRRRERRHRRPDRRGGAPVATSRPHLCRRRSRRQRLGRDRRDHRRRARRAAPVREHSRTGLSRAAERMPLAALPLALFAADVDRDGLVDALTVSEQEITLWRGDGAGEVRAQRRRRGRRHHRARTAQSISRRRRGAGSHRRRRTVAPRTHVRVLLNDGTGALRERAAYSVESAYGWIVDRDRRRERRDGALDLVVGDGACVDRRAPGTRRWRVWRRAHDRHCRLRRRDLQCGGGRGRPQPHGLGRRGDGAHGPSRRAARTFAPVAAARRAPSPIWTATGRSIVSTGQWPDGALDVRLGGSDGIFTGGYAFASGGCCEALASADLSADGIMWFARSRPKRRQRRVSESPDDRA